MKTTTPLLVLFDLWCLLAIAQLPLIYNMDGFYKPIVNYLIILAITYFAFHGFITDNRGVNRMHTVAWTLRWLALGLTLVAFAATIVSYSLHLI